MMRGTYGPRTTDHGATALFAAAAGWKPTTLLGAALSRDKGWNVGFITDVANRTYPTLGPFVLNFDNALQSSTVT